LQYFSRQDKISFGVKMSPKKRLIVEALLAFLAFLLGAFIFSSGWPVGREFQGTFTFAFEGMDFQPDKSS
jgi:hypothetical protein